MDINTAEQDAVGFYATKVKPAIDKVVAFAKAHPTASAVGAAIILGFVAGAVIF